MRIASTLARMALAALAFVFATPAAAQNFLWKVESLTNHVYLFGTMHAGRSEWFPLPLQVEQAFLDCPVLMVEADITDREAMIAGSRGSTYKPPDSLAQHVDRADYTRFMQLARRFRVPAAELDEMKPFMAASLLVFAEWARLGYLPQFSVDAYLLEAAHKSGKRVVELEGVAAQMKLIDSLTDAQNRAVFAGTVQALGNGMVDRQIAGIAHAWETGDAEQMLEIAHEYDARVRGAAEVEQKFVWSRNPAMLAKIAAVLDTGSEPHFVAVGALHLVGAKGLVAALRARGYQVRRIFVAPQGEDKP